MPPIGIGAALAIGGLSAGGSIAGAALGSSAAGHAADIQAAAANQAAQLQYQSGQNALDFQKQIYANQQTQLQPYLNTGYSALANLGYQMGLAQPNPVSYPPTQPQPKVVTKATAPLSELTVAGQGLPRYGTGGFNTPTGTLNAGSVPTAQPVNLQTLINPSLGAAGSLLQAPSVTVNETSDPGYQFRLNQGMQALQRSAAAKGNLLSGGTAKALQQYGQDYASNEYQNVYNRAVQDQANKYNRLASMAGLGQTSVNQLGQAGQAAAGNVGNILLASGQQVGNNINNAAAARASGYVGGANAWGNALSGGTGNLMQLLLMQQLYGGGNSNLGSGSLAGVYDPNAPFYPG